MIVYKLNTVPNYENAVQIVHANEGEFGGQWVFDIREGDTIFDQTYGVPEVTINILKVFSSGRVRRRPRRTSSLMLSGHP